MLTEADLTHYGVPLYAYRGDGVLTLSNGQKVKCTFAASQIESGNVVLLCACNEQLLNLVIGNSEVRSFSGITHDGLHVESSCNVYETSYLPRALPAIGTCLALLVNLKVSRSSELSCSRRTFLLVNLAGIFRSISFSIHNGLIVIRPIDNTMVNLRRLNVIRDVLPTAELEMEASGSSESDFEVVVEVCYLLSIAVGTKIQWIAHTDWSSSADWIKRSHYGLRVTKRYCPLPIIDLAPGTSSLKVFLGVVGNKRLVDARKSTGLTQAVIDTYLDAKAEGDFLQARALKLVIAVEMLKAEFQSARGISPLGIPMCNYASLRKPIKEAVRNVIVDKTTDKERSIIYSNLGGLNRITFKEQLRQLLSAVNMEYGDDDLDHFVMSRNKLVHEGRFYCENASSQDQARVTPLGSPSKEWCWLLHFVDRLFLRASGYSGLYMNWSTPGDPGIDTL